MLANATPTNRSACNGFFIPSQPGDLFSNARNDIGFVQISRHRLWQLIQRRRDSLMAVAPARTHGASIHAHPCGWANRSRHRRVRPPAWFQSAPALAGGRIASFASSCLQSQKARLCANPFIGPMLNFNFLKSFTKNPNQSTTYETREPVSCVSTT